MTSIIRIATIVLLLVSQHAGAQALTKMQEVVESARGRGNSFSKIPLFSRLSDPEAAMQQTLTRGGLLALDKVELQQVRKAKPESITLELPFSASRTITVELVKNEIFTSDFKVSSSAPNAEAAGYQQGVYYQGIVRNTQGRSLAAISIVGDEVIGVIDVEGEGNFILGELEGDERGRYAFFRADDLKHNMKTSCGVEDIPQTVLETAEQIGLNAEDPNKCVRIYFECEHDMYLSRGSSVQNTVDFMTGIYNVVKTLYDNERVNTAISEIFVWNTPDNYPTTSTVDALYAFRTARGTSFNGNLAHLVSRGEPSGGGVAFLEGTCNRGSAFAYSAIHESYNQFPAYSWTVMVIAHEMGHNLGSNHTHRCAWDVSGTGISDQAIDGCGPTVGYNEGSCPIAPLPTNGGSVMSYCHMVSGVGINFNNGFGPLPGALIRNRVYNGTCLTACNPCATTVAITKTDVKCFGGNSGSITSSGGGSAAPYTYLWNTGATTATISNLVAGTYTVTVRGDNGAGCATSATVTITQPAVLNPTAVVAPESVPGAGNGSIDVTVTGGTAPFTYLWSNGATTQDLINIAGGSYTVTVTDSKGCTAQGNYVVGTTPPCNAPTLSTSSTAVSCAGGTNGSASVQATGGTTPYGYAWSNGGTTATIQGIPAGTYTVTVTDAGGCKATAAAVVTQPTPLTASAIARHVSATGATDGEVTLSVTGGTLFYSYTWSNGATTQNLTQVGAGTYHVTVTDAKGCKTNASAIVSVKPVTCQPVSVIPYAEGFESGLGLWTQATNDNFDWRRNSGGTPTNNTGPSGAASGNFYMYTEANDASRGATAILESPCFNLSGIANAQVSFTWLLYGNQMGSLVLQVTKDNGNTWTNLWSRSGNHGISWTNHSVSLAALQNEVIKLRFVGTLANGVRGDMALDNVVVTGGAGLGQMITTAGSAGLEWKRVFPNPTTGRVNLEIYSAQATTIHLSVVDVLGRTSDLGKHALSAGNNVIGVNLPAGGNGVFMLKMLEGGRVQSKPVMMMR